MGQLQRASAAVLAVCVAVHLVTMIVAVHGGLSAAAILGRTRGSVGWTAFYGLFVVAVAIHAPLGLRTVAAEWLGWRGRAADVAMVRRWCSPARARRARSGGGGAMMRN